MQLKVSCYQLIVECYNYKKFYARLMATLKRNPTASTKIIKKEKNQIILLQKLHQITQEDTNRGKKGTKELQN